MSAKPSINLKMIKENGTLQSVCVVFLDTILDSSKLELNAEQEKRVIKLRGILNKAVLESKVMNF